MLSNAWIVAIVFGAVIVLFVIAIFIWVFRYPSRKYDKMVDDKIESFEQTEIPYRKFSKATDDRWNQLLHSYEQEQKSKR